MNSLKIEELLSQAQSGQLSWSALAERLLQQEHADDAEHRPDLDRARRCGFGEVIFGSGKTVAAIEHIAGRLLDSGQGEVLVTRVDATSASARGNVSISVVTTNLAGRSGYRGGRSERSRPTFRRKLTTRPPLPCPASQLPSSLQAAPTLPSPAKRSRLWAGWGSRPISSPMWVWPVRTVCSRTSSVSGNAWPLWSLPVWKRPGQRGGRSSPLPCCGGTHQRRVWFQFRGHHDAAEYDE